MVSVMRNGKLMIRESDSQSIDKAYLVKTLAVLCHDCPINAIYNAHIDAGFYFGTINRCCGPSAFRH